MPTQVESGVVRRPRQLRVAGHEAQVQIFDRDQIVCHHQLPGALCQSSRRWLAIRLCSPAGFVDDGWKDPVLVMPGETVPVLMRCPDPAGMVVYHCHNLEHADQGMMRNFAAEVR